MVLVAGEGVTAGLRPAFATRHSASRRAGFKSLPDPGNPSTAEPPSDFSRSNPDSPDHEESVTIASTVKKKGSGREREIFF